MEPLDGCRLCLDPFSDNASSLESEDLQKQIKSVFSFTIESNETLSTNVCQSCTYTIAEFYQYSEKVRENQDKLLLGQANACEESKPAITDDTVKVELLEEVEDRDDEDRDPDWSLEKKPKLESSEEESDTFSDGEIFVEQHEPLPERKPRQKRRPETKPRRKRAAVQEPLEEDESKLKMRQERAETDRQINEFFLMKCDLCGVVEESFQLLRAHFSKYHEVRGYIVCCKKKYNKRYALLEHMDLHANPNAFRCEICQKNYKNKVTLALHMVKTHASEEERPFKCDRCTQSFSKSYMLKTHMSSHEKAQCPKCEKILANKSALSVHLINVHSDIDRRMICDSCGQEFLNKVCFERHVKEHAGIEVVKKLQCHICQKWLRGERGLQKHLQFTHYERDQTHICDVCQQQYPNSRALWSHKRTVHIAEKFECEFCGKRFKRASNLKEHRTIHTGEVLYACDYCGSTMNSKANLYTHTKKNHPLEWAEKRQRAAEASAPKPPS